ncbi:MAG TPA: glycosyltransferase family 39 protein [Anaerolineales bacterium]|nr:glycosyltransferase family 39 protein [Anaerolineales bacterium]
MIGRFIAGLPAALRMRDLTGKVLTALPTARVIEFLLVAGILAIAAAVRLTMLTALGFNSDEAVYAGQAAAIAGDSNLDPLFPVFRAHPLLFQYLLSLVFQLGVSELAGRLLAALAGVTTVYLVYHLGANLYGRPVGALSALLLALMPYHAVVTRQVLLDGPMTMFTTLGLLLLVRYGREQKPSDLVAAGAALGLAFLTKETALLMFGSLYAFFALSPDIRLRIRDVLIAAAVAIGLMSLYPLTVLGAGSGVSGTAQQYLVWQFFRYPNHTWDFYLRTIPFEMGPLVVFLALLGLWTLRRSHSWRETLLLAWIAVPVVFFQLWPTKGYQYLLPAAPAVAVLAGRALAGLFAPPGGAQPGVGWSSRLLPAAFTVVAFSLLASTYFIVFPQPASQSLAGSGGVPGGREAGLWVRANLPEGSTLMTIGPSMANILQFYGHHRAYGLSVSANPLYRNPVYIPITNPDLQIRMGEIQYLVWDAFSANRSEFFSTRLLAYVQKYNGRVAYTETIPVRTAAGAVIEEPVIIIYRMYP